MKTKYKCLYEITGCIEDVATFLVPISDLPKEPEQEPVATNKIYVTREQLAELYPPAQRTWVGLTDKEIDQGLLRTNYAMQTAGAWRDGVEWAMTQLREKNAP